MFVGMFCRISCIKFSFWKDLNDLIIEAIKKGDIDRALEYLEKDNERIAKALEE